MIRAMVRRLVFRAAQINYLDQINRSVSMVVTGLTRTIIVAEQETTGTEPPPEESGVGDTH
jgi:hypothetical protein